MANRFKSLIDDEEERKKPVVNVNPSNGGNRFGSLLDQPTSQPIQPSQVANKPTFQFMSAHTPTSQSTNQPSLKTAFIKGTLGSLVGRATTPLVEKVTGRDVDLSTLPESETFGQKAIETGSNLVADLPLWLAGDAILAKPLGALAKTAPVAKTLNIVPKAIQPALGTGVRAGTTYGLPINALETAMDGDGVEGFTDRLKEVPFMALGGTALHGAGQVIGKGVREGLNLRSNLIADKRVRNMTTPEEDFQRAFYNPTKVRDVKADQLNKTFADTSNNLGNTGQIAPKQGMNPNELLRQKQLDAEGVFGKPINNKKYTFKTSEQKAFQELQDGISEAQNYVRHTDVLAPYPAGTTIEQAYADIKANIGVDLPKLMEAWNKTQTLKNRMTPEELRLGRASGVVPKLKPRDTSFPAKIESESPIPRQSIEPTQERLTWTNRDGISNAGQQPVKSITNDNVNKILGRDLPIKNELIPINENPNVGTPTVNTEMPMVNGNGTQINPTQNTRSIKDITEPNIPTGQKERGFSENTRTDVNNPDALRDSYTENPLTYEQLGNSETLAKAQAIFDQGYESARTQLGDLASKMQPEAIPLAKLLSRQATESGNIQGAREIISTVADKLTQAGQFSQAARILREADPETFLMTIGKQLKKLNQEGLENYGKNWKNFDLTPDELKLISNIERGNQASYESAFEQIQARIANEMPASAMEKINAWRHMSMLLNPKTHIRNVVGNGIMMSMRKSAQRVSGVLQKVLPQEKRTQSVFINKEYKNLAKDYFETNKKDLLSGANKYQDNVSVNMPNKRVFKNNVLEKARKFNYDLLQWGDNPFFKNAYIDRLASYAQSKGIKDFTKLSQEAFDIAKLEAEQATYKDASKIASFINDIKHPKKDANLLEHAGAFITEAALPFTKTPINIVKRGIQYSPMGIANGLSKINSKKGAASAIDELAKGLTGTGILGLGYLLASKGILTGKAEKDIDLKNYDKNTGNSPFSILGKYSYDWMMPFSIPLSVGVEIHNAIKDNPEDIAKMDGVISNNDTSILGQLASTIGTGLLEGFTASGDTVFNLSFMKGIKTLLGGEQGFMDGMLQLPQNYATQFIPTMANQFAGTVDPTVRQSYVKGDRVETAKNALVSRIPFASKTLEPKQTPFGEDVKRIENPITRTASQFLSPGIVAKDQNIDPEIGAELRRLNEYGLTNQFPTMVNNYIEKTQTHPKIPLTAKETTEYQKRVGTLTLKSFDKTMNSSDYKYAKDNKKKNKSADEIKADLLAKAISDAKAQAKKEILKSKGLK